MSQHSRRGSARRAPGTTRGAPSTADEAAAAEDTAAAPGSREEQQEAARAVVLRQLTASAKSRRQLEEKLAARDIPEDVVAEVLDRFEEVGLVDDRAFAAMFVRSRAETRKLSRSALRRELAQRGIGGDMAEEALEQRTDEDEARDAHELVRKKLPAAVDPADRGAQEKLTRRLVAMLGRKGYPSSTAFAVVKEELAALGGVEQEDQLDPHGAEVWDTP